MVTFNMNDDTDGVPDSINSTPNDLEFSLPFQHSSSSESESEPDDADGDDTVSSERHGPGVLTQSAANDLLLLAAPKQEEEEEEETVVDDLEGFDHEPDTVAVIDSVIADSVNRGSTITPPPIRLQQTQPPSPVVVRKQEGAVSFDQRLHAKAREFFRKFKMKSFETAIAMAHDALTNTSNSPSPPAFRTLPTPVQPTVPPTTATVTTTQSIDRAFALAKQLHVEDGDGLGFTEEELRSYKQCDRSSTQKRYDKRHDNTEKRFFDCIKQYGGESLECLVREEPAQYDQLLQRDDYAFYNIVGGDKNEAKRKILNTCLCLAAFKFVCLSGDRKGDPLEPVSFEYVMKILFYRFADKGVLYNFKKDFNGTGEFHGLLVDHWQKIRLENPHFGQRKKHAHYDVQGDQKLLDAYKQRKFDPYYKPWDLVRGVVLNLGRFWGCRGAEEIYGLQRSQVIIGRHPIDHQYAGLAFCSINHGFDKSHTLGLNHTRARNEEEFPNQVTENVNDPLCAVRMISFLLSKSDDDPDGAPCRLFGKVRTGKAFKIKGNWFLAGKNSVANRNIGQKKIASCVKELAKIAGFEKWWLCTNHGQRRALQNAMIEAGISIEARAAKMRHNSIQSQVHYFNAQGATKDTTDVLIQRSIAPERKRPPPALPAAPVKQEYVSDVQDEEAALLAQLEAVRSAKKQRYIPHSHSFPPSVQSFNQPLVQQMPTTYVIQTGPNGEQIIVPSQSVQQTQWNGQVLAPIQQYHRPAQHHHHDPARFVQYQNQSQQSAGQPSTYQPRMGAFGGPFGRGDDH